MTNNHANRNRWRVVRGAHQWFVLRGTSLVYGSASWGDAYFYAVERSSKEIYS